ncbi:MAG: hypothetical protein EAZ07_01395 [Cytophagales bacterium]|nr:MAG: hypothetical protein EAZ07_01395 [Cytophagales bacterium]
MERRDFLKYSATSLAGAVMLNHNSEAFLFNQNSGKPKNAYFIWNNQDDGLGRNLFSNFRRSFFLTAVPDSAELNIFADTSYQLFINGQFVQFGPIRFDPRFPVYDKHNISSFLKTGENVIAIQVNHYGCKTYKSITTRAGLLAWGFAKSPKEEVLFNTNDKDWKAKPSMAHEYYAYKMSFALNPVDFYDQSKEYKGWKNINFLEVSSWQNAKIIKEQNNWGTPSEREIPFMNNLPIKNIKVSHLLPLLKIEDLYSFEVPFPAHYNDGEQRKYILFKTYVYSEVDQNITVGTFYGELWLNGIMQDRGFETNAQSMRINQIWSLKKGWNYLYGSVRIYHDVLHHYFAVPTNKGILFNADKSLNGTTRFYRSDLVSSENFAQLFPDQTKPLFENKNIDSIGGWIKVDDKNKAQSAARESSWDNYGSQIENLRPNKLEGNTIAFKNYSKGFSLTIDLLQTRLMIPFIEFHGVKGAIIDIIYSEQFCDDNQHLLMNFNYAPADRLLCSEDVIEWFPSTSRGARYVKVTFRNISTDITIKKLSFNSANYPVEEIGEFSCSEPLYNAIWEMGKNTEATNMEDAYVDCPSRERAMYIRDTIIQYHVNLAAFGDQKLMKRCLELYGQSPDKTNKFRAVYPNTGDYTIADFSLNMVEGFKAYFENTGDKTFIKNYWLSIKKNLAWFDELSDERPDRLLDSEWHIKRKINAHYGGFHGDLGIAKGLASTVGIHCVFSITYLIALKDALVLAKAIGANEDAQKLNDRIKVLSSSININFWDDNKKCYADNLNKDTYSIHAALFAIRAGIVSEDKLPYVKAHVRKNLPGIFLNGYNADEGVYISPSFAFYIFDGLYKAGLEDIAEKIIKQGWGWMLYSGMKTCPEYFDFNNSLCHAWSASPTYYLSKYVLGVNFPQAPNLDIVEIKVQTSTINSAEGKYPHPKGAIEIKWHTENGKRIFDYIKTPVGVNYKIIEQ